MTKKLLTTFLKTMQSLLFELPPHRHYIETQHEAAINVAEKVPARRRAVLFALRTAKCGLTREELSHDLGLPIQSICGVVKPMIDDGQIEYRIDPETGKPHKRPTLSGNNAYVCFAVEPNA